MDQGEKIFTIKEKCNIWNWAQRRLLNKPCQPFGACVSRLTPIPKHCTQSQSKLSLHSQDDEEKNIKQKDDTQAKWKN